MYITECADRVSVVQAHPRTENAKTPNATNANKESGLGGNDTKLRKMVLICGASRDADLISQSGKFGGVAIIRYIMHIRDYA